MLNKINLFFEKFIRSKEENNQETQQHQLNLAVSALLIEMVYIDNQSTEKEVQHLKNILIKQYHLLDDQIETLTILAKQELNDATDYYQFTSLINQNFNAEEKVLMIKQLWEIALADDNIDKHEEHYIRKIAELIFVPHSVFIKTKLQILDNQN